MAQAGASRFGEAFDVAPCEQVARHLAVLFERRDHPQRFVALGFDIVERSPEHGRVANGAIGKSPIQALDFAFCLAQLLAQLLGFGGVHFGLIPSAIEQTP
jgi:hypothetical protein